MTMNHHLSDELLMQYEAGSLAEGWGIAVATHLAYCPECRARAERLKAVGGAMLETIEVAPLREGALEAALSRLDAAPAETPRRYQGDAEGVPEPLRSYVGGDLDAIAWKSLGTGAKQAIIATGDSETTVRLLRIAAGEPVPEHGHRGMELTVVLRGTLVDDDERFEIGDIEEANDAVQHQPRASEDSECICLAVTDAPLRFKNIFVRLAQPFLGI